MTRILKKKPVKKKEDDVVVETTKSTNLAEVSRGIGVGVGVGEREIQGIEQINLNTLNPPIQGHTGSSSRPKQVVPQSDGKEQSLMNTQSKATTNNNAQEGEIITSFNYSSKPLQNKQNKKNDNHT
eukprot:CAMPEP_0116912486 /NCGR_PEP_ID=MMETSP0467-20121206/16116_1 /TAXON_ID=283647 /ORGANISM="Mesodinium pulex, Strain SPMC105" /LENGTH=125 /DNA_ID=CAMNT_0004588477 /DNA_START=2168 /DNA_END=2545 /DNA_ORIENTATION=+